MYLGVCSLVGNHCYFNHLSYMHFATAVTLLGPAPGMLPWQSAEAT